VTSYFNPQRYRTRRRNYRRFRRGIDAAGLPLLTIECAFGDMPFELPAAPDVVLGMLFAAAYVKTHPSV